VSDWHQSSFAVDPAKVARDDRQGDGPG